MLHAVNLKRDWFKLVYVTPTWKMEKIIDPILEMLLQDVEVLNVNTV